MMVWLINKKGNLWTKRASLQAKHQRILKGMATHQDDSLRRAFANTVDVCCLKHGVAVASLQKHTQSQSFLLAT